MEWISVKDRLPDKDCIEVVCLVNKDPMVLTHFLPSEESNEHRFYCGYRKHWDELSSFVTHWMPLPEPPKF